MPLPLLAIAAGAQVAGGLLNAYSQYSQYQEQKATTKYNQAIIDANLRIDNALTDMDIRRIREEGEELIGTQRALIGKSGTKFSGSNIDVFMDTVRDIEMDVTTMELGKMVSGVRARQEKQLMADDLAASKRALPLKIASSVLGTASNVATTVSRGR